MQNLKPNNLEFFVRPNSKCKVVDSPMIILAIFKFCDEIPDIILKQLANLVRKI